MRLDDFINKSTSGSYSYAAELNKETSLIVGLSVEQLRWACCFRASCFLVAVEGAIFFDFAFHTQTFAAVHEIQFTNLLVTECLL